MGTRNLTCVQKDGKLIVAKYCQWDGYINGQGKIIVDFIVNKFNKDIFIEKLSNIKDITDKSLNALWKKCGAKDNAQFVSMDVSDKFAKKYPHLHRDMGGAILESIQNSTDTVFLRNDKEFAKDSLFCEYAYVLNLDTDTLDVYTGFKTKKSSDSIFYNREKDKVEKRGDGEIYYPIGLLCSLKFSLIQKLGVDKAVKRIENKEKKEERK